MRDDAVLIGAVLVAVLAIGLLAGCANDQPVDTGEEGDAREVRIVATSFAYDPSQVTVQPGERLHVVLINRGDAPHNIDIELPTGEVALDSPVSPGESADLRFTAPSEPGEYTYYCPIADHRERGMTGTLRVE